MSVIDAIVLKALASSCDGAATSDELRRATGLSEIQIRDALVNLRFQQFIRRRKQLTFKPGLPRIYYQITDCGRHVLKMREKDLG